ncbi:hypothetical protein Krac_1413 [Ktedonobacter racemifer DSM 44963]|uniref:Uncharacterized protein n=1 Tax=Ktedonobacter racemifer DSM 44963 TaxID=485913 RepID=D6U1E0_KTERA|nr:hypothetical protein Krac_1413 [Ktedonobacter racemifer DSM 44963]
MQLHQVVFLKSTGGALIADITHLAVSDRRFETFLQTRVAQPSSSPSSTDYRSLVKKVGNTLLVGEATLAEVLEGLVAIEAQWSKQQVRPQTSGTQQPTAPSSQQTSHSPKDIVDIGLGYKDQRHPQWINNHDVLSAKINTLSDPQGSISLVQAIFRKREGRELVIKVIKGEKDHHQLNVILSYLEADLQKLDVEDDKR